jgi:predicted Zn finger-like uncharacterized protein
VRLLCPKCDAEYEIPNDVIPAEGRDVQCSGCQETWFVPADQPPRARTTIDPKVSRILQQEVQREMEARKAETRGASETAPEQAPATNDLPLARRAQRQKPRRPRRVCRPLIGSKFPLSSAQQRMPRP